jgi:hypothetical protein
MITKEQAMSGGLGTTSGAGKAIALIDSRVRNGSTTMLFNPYEIPKNEREFIRSYMQGKGWSCTIEDVQEKDGDWRDGYVTVDKVRVVLQ